MIRSLAFPSPYERFAQNIFDLRKIAKQFPRGVSFEHVYAHSNNPGNEEVSIPSNFYRKLI